ncbi:MAG: hypothetical protein K2X38_00225 [Gemmataceae bacterium]|nr:hypothetical protein [Gemmataceae bacterium]
MRFVAQGVRFGKRPAQAEDEGDGIPRPHMAKLIARRQAGIREAADLMACLPEPGESLHCVMTARLDMTDVLNALIERKGRCERLTIATLGFNRRNFLMMLRWLDSGAVASLSLVASKFFRSHNGELWDETLKEFGERKQRAACCPCHAKVMALAFADGSRFAIEGSANLCSNGSAREQFALVNDAALSDWHARWIEELVRKHARHEVAS